MSHSDEPIVTLLFVDDSVTDRTRGVGLIRKHHPEWHVIPADDGREALQVLDNGNVDLVVSDLIMPGIDGRELLKVIVSDYPLTPVVLITSQGDDRIAAECLNLGAVNYVPKRLLAAELVTVLDDVVRAQQESAELRRVFQHATRNQCEFSIENDVNEIRSLLSFVQNRLQAYDVLSPQRVRQLTSAIRESLLNAYYHGNLEVSAECQPLSRVEYVAVAAARRQDPEYAERRIGFCMSLQPDVIEVCVSDDGNGFDHAQRREVASAPSSNSSSGQGLEIIRESVDDWCFNEKGNEITLTVQRNQKS